MLGAGVFVVFAPAAGAAGGLGLVVATLFGAGCGGVLQRGFCWRGWPRAIRTRAAPTCTGGNCYLRFPGFLAGWAFVTGKTASCAAMALAIGGG